MRGYNSVARLAYKPRSHEEEFMERRREVVEDLCCRYMRSSAPKYDARVGYLNGEEEGTPRESRESVSTSKCRAPNGLPTIRSSKIIHRPGMAHKDSSSRSSYT